MERVEPKEHPFLKVEWILDCKRDLDPPLITKSIEKPKTIPVKEGFKSDMTSNFWSEYASKFDHLSQLVKEEGAELQNLQKKIEENTKNLQKEAEVLKDFLKKLEKTLRKFF